jgi:hypothetical protein
MTIRLHNYAEVRVYLEKEHPDWLRALTPKKFRLRSFRSHHPQPREKGEQ